MNHQPPCPGHQSPGLFLSFEGPEGCGKTTHAREVQQRLEASGREVTYVREPGGTATGEAVRDILQHDAAGEPLCNESETLLFAASRAQLVRQVIGPALEAGHVVVSDRYVDSTIAYQGYGRGFGLETILRISEFATGGLWPHRTILLDLDIATGSARMTARNEACGSSADRIEREPVAFHEAVRDGYLALAKRWPERYVIIDASGSITSVQADVWAAVAAALGGP